MRYRLFAAATRIVVGLLLTLPFVTQATNSDNERIKLGNRARSGGIVDSWRSNLVVDLTDTYTNTTADTQEIRVDRFRFFARRQGDPITPFVVRVDDHELTVLKIGTTREHYDRGTNKVRFQQHEAPVIELAPGETIAVGFSDAEPDGSCGYYASRGVIVFDRKSPRHEIYLSGGWHPSHSAQIIEGQPIIPGRKTLRHLRRNYHFNIKMTLLGGGTTAPTEGPGGVTMDLALWLRGDGILTRSNGDVLPLWEDLSGGSRDAVVDGLGNFVNDTTVSDDAAAPTFLDGDNGINFNPVVRFNGPTDAATVAEALHLGSKTIFSDMDGLSFYGVARPNKPGNGNFVFEFGHATGHAYGFGYGTDGGLFETPTCFGGKAAEFSHSRGNQTTLFGGRIAFSPDGTDPGAMHLYLDGSEFTGDSFPQSITTKQLTSTEIRAQSQPTASGENEEDGGPFTIGRQSKITTDNSQNTQSYGGDLAELIVYTDDVDGSNRAKIESYLGIKYGVTLYQTPPRDYLASDGSVVFPSASSHDLYDRDIAGIGRDDRSQLMQLRSMSINPGSVLQMQTTSLADDLSYTVWGHDGEPPVVIDGRLARTWRTRETGDVGAVTIRIPVTVSPLLDSLLVSLDPAFPAGAATTTIPLTSDGMTYFASVDLPQDAYLTFNVAPANQAPTIEDPGDQTSIEGDAIDLTIVAEDLDGDTLTYEAIDLPPGLSIDTDTGAILGSIAAGAEGNYTVTLTISDGMDQTSGSFSWTVLDFDECAAGADSCDLNATCSNSSDGFTCSCNAGYAGDGFTCGDVDECADGSAGCDANAACTNTAGGFTCDCLPGFTGDGQTCADVDECAENTDSCDPNAICSNTQGSFACDCLPGYAGDGQTCADVDECADATDNCDANASCANTDGSFTCDCLPGFSGDGVTCSSTNGAPVLPAIAGRTDHERDAPNIAAGGTDPEGDPISYSAINLPPGMCIDAETGLISGVLTGGSGGVYATQVQASDGISTTTVDFTWVVFPPGSGDGTIRGEVWVNIPGTAVSDLTSDPRYPNAPTAVDLIPMYESTQNLTENWGLRTHGYLHPPADGDYRLYIASRDNSELYLSSDEDPANAVLIASVPGLTDPREWDAFPEQQSAVVTLEGGKRYYIASLSKHGTGPDHKAVGLEPVGGSIVVIDGQYLSPSSFNLALPTIANPGTQLDAVGSSVTLDITGEAVGGTFSASGLPNGLAIDTATGQISGVIAAGGAGVYPVQVSVTNAAGTDSVDFGWVVPMSSAGGNVIYGVNSERQIVSLDLDAGTECVEGELSLPSLGAGLDENTGRIYFFESGSAADELAYWDPTTEISTPVRSYAPATFLARRMGQSPDNTMYVMDQSENLLSLDLATGDLNFLGTVSGIPIGSFGSTGDLAFAPDGTLYANSNDTIYTIDLGTLQGTALFSGVLPNPGPGQETWTGLAFCNGLLWATDAQEITGKSALYAFDPVTGAFAEVFLSSTFFNDLTSCAN